MFVDACHYRNEEDGKTDTDRGFSGSWGRSRVMFLSFGRLLKGFPGASGGVLGVGWEHLGALSAAGSVGGEG